MQKAIFPALFVLNEHMRNFVPPPSNEMPTIPSETYPLFAILTDTSTGASSKRS